LRFSVVGPLLASPPEKGRLQRTLRQLAQQQWLHPITTLPVIFGLSTIQRWYYQAKDAADPVTVFRPKRREDTGRQRVLDHPIKQALKAQYKAHKSWSYQLHTDNLQALTQQQPALGVAPSYSTVRRYMKAQGMAKQRRVLQRSTEGTLAAEQRLENREVRSDEVDHIHGLWHLDFHHGSRKILMEDGRWLTPMLLAIMDDRSRIICHAQWYLNETAETLVHGFAQAIQKRQLPRALMSDNGSAMTSAEFTQGLERLGILHKTTLPYSPYQNGKQEFFWTHIEGQLLPMLEGESDLTLSLLNNATHAWLEQEYHHRQHSELGCSPIQRYLDDPNVGRSSPNSLQLRQAFRQQVKRKQRRSDGTISLAGQRFEIPSRYRHLETVFVQYARWDLTQIGLVDSQDNSLLCRLYPLDKSENATGKRRVLEQDSRHRDADTAAPPGIAPLLENLMADYAATGLPPAYIPQDNMKPDQQEEKQ
jgi:transposase InsO family protein